MPQYEYECPNCGTFDIEQKITDEPIRQCPKCKAEVERNICSTGFVLKGTGWYRDGYQKKAKKTPD